MTELLQGHLINEGRGEKWKAEHGIVLRHTLNHLTANEIADKMHRSADWVNRIRCSVEFKTRKELALRSVVEKVQEVFENKALEAAKTIITLAKEGQTADRVRLEASKDILDRIGYKPVQVIETRQRAYTPGEIDSAKKTIGELEDTLVRLERHDSVFVMKKRDRSEVAPMTQPIENVEPVSQPSQDRPQAVSA